MAAYWIPSHIEHANRSPYNMHFIQTSSLSSWIAFDLQLACMWTLRFGGGKILEIFFFFYVWHTINSNPFFFFSAVVGDKLKMTFEREREKRRKCDGGNGENGGITSTASKRHRICVIAWHEDYSTRDEESSVYFWLCKLRLKCDIMKMKKDLRRQLAHSDQEMQFSDDANATATIVDTTKEWVLSLSVL